MIKPPVGALLDEAQVALILKSQVAQHERLEHKPHLEQFAVRVLALLLQLLALVGDVHVLHVERVAGGHEKIVVAVKVNIHKNRRPRPLRCREVGMEPDLGVGAVAVVQVNGVVTVLRPVVVHTKTQFRRLAVAQLGVPQNMLAAEHVNDDEFIEAIPIEIREIDPHREMTALADGQPIDGPEDALALVDPDSVGRLEVIANVEIGAAVSVHVPKHGGQPPVIRRLGQALAVLVEEGAGGEGDGSEPAAAIVEIEAIRLAMFKNFPVGLEREAPHRIGGF